VEAVEVAAQVADQAATEAREQALDPNVVVDTAKVGAAVATPELTRPRLRTRYTEVRKQEDIAAWKADAEKLVARRDTLAMEFFKLLFWGRDSPIGCYGISGGIARITPP
jgi:hypothetical protein